MAQSHYGSLWFYLTPDYIESRISALQNPKDKSTQEFKSKYGETYLNQVIEWFKQAGQGK